MWVGVSGECVCEWVYLVNVCAHTCVLFFMLDIAKQLFQDFLMTCMPYLQLLSPPMNWWASKHFTLMFWNKLHNVWLLTYRTLCSIPRWCMVMIRNFTDTFGTRQVLVWQLRAGGRGGGEGAGWEPTSTGDCSSRSYWTDKWLSAAGQWLGLPRVLSAYGEMVSMYFRRLLTFLL